ncbi:MAG TPA: hypothetical protein DCY79_07955 [Planctomycetaceae bacterium]|nr:hypothetical protein [Planctomycetaceae bacterium]
MRRKPLNDLPTGGQTLNPVQPWTDHVAGAFQPRHLRPCGAMTTDKSVNRRHLRAATARNVDGTTHAWKRAGRGPAMTSPLDSVTAGIAPIGFALSDPYHNAMTCRQTEHTFMDCRAQFKLQS